MQEQERKAALIRALIKRRLRASAVGGALRSPIPLCDAPVIPLSAAQKRIWLMQQLEPDTSFANRPLAVRLKGLVDQQVLMQSLSAIVQRHEALRTVFPVKNGEPVQQILTTWTLTPTVIDLRSLPQPQQDAEARKLAIAEARKTFDLAEGPLIRTVLMQLSESDHVLLLLMHHIIFDGWSEGILLGELKRLYGATLINQPANLPELPIQYKDFTCWQQKRLDEPFLSEQMSYWRRQLADNLSVLELPTDYPRSNKRTLQARYQSLLLPESLTESLKCLSQQAGATLFMALLASLQTLLYRYTDQERIAVGVPVAGRNRPETETLIGVFMNTLVLQSDLSGNPTFRKLLGHVREISLGAFTHQELPFEKLVEVLKPTRLTSRWPLFQVMFNFRNISQTKSANTEALRIEPFDCDWGMLGGLDLSLDIVQGPAGLNCQFSYPAELFREDTIRRLAAHFRALLENAVADPDQSIGCLALMTPDEQHQVLVGYNRTQASYPDQVCVHDMVEAQAKRTPDSVAVTFEGEHLSYRQLNQAANQLAHHLKTQGVGPDVTVGICVERSPDMVVGLLAILKAGGAYVPLDPEYPRERLDFIVKDSNPSVLLTQNRLRNALPDSGAPVICLDSDRCLWADADDHNPDPATTADNLVYVIYTSGTTGYPKGVMITHRAACNHLYWRQDYFPLTGSDRVLQKASLNFDDSFWEIFEPLTTGAQLVIAHPGKHQDVRYLVHTIVKRKISAFCLVPSVLQLFVEEPKVETCTTLRRVTTGGEILSAEVQQRFFQRLKADLYNGYGPTESTIAVTYWKCQRDDTRTTVPIGRPIGNTQVYLLDARLQPVPIGVPGELHIGGATLARGYLNHPELTTERFIENPLSTPGVTSSRLYKTGDRARYLPDGTIEFLGRLDDQVKIRGIRIELGEIEMVLKKHPKVQQVVVIDRNDESVDKRLVAYVVTEDDEALDTGEFRQFLQQTLPAYMIPSVFVKLITFPLTANGKIDRRALPKPKVSDMRAAVTYTAPRTPLEQQLADIWAQILKLEQVGMHDNFFELGGHSLLAMQVIARIHDVIQVEVPLRQLFETPTIEAIALSITQRQLDGLNEAELVQFFADSDD
jgi:amino acid adenylation domain-containing protein